MAFLLTRGKGEQRTAGRAGLRDGGAKENGEGMLPGRKRDSFAKRKNPVEDEETRRSEMEVETRSMVKTREREDGSSRGPKACRGVGEGKDCIKEEAVHRHGSLDQATKAAVSNTGCSTPVAT